MFLGLCCSLNFEVRRSWKQPVIMSFNTVQLVFSLALFKLGVCLDNVVEIGPGMNASGPSFSPNFPDQDKSHPLCRKLVPEKLEKCDPETSPSPYLFQAKCRKDWSYCIVQINSTTPGTPFQEAYVSAENLHCEDKKGKLMGHFKNAWPGKHSCKNKEIPYFVRKNYYCGKLNRDFEGQQMYNLYNPVMVAAPDQDSGFETAQFIWKKISERGEDDDRAVIFRATVVQYAKKYWTDLTAMVVPLYD